MVQKKILCYTLLKMLMHVRESSVIALIYVDSFR